MSVLQPCVDCENGLRWALRWRREHGPSTTLEFPSVDAVVSFIERVLSQTSPLGDVVELDVHMPAEP